MAVAITSANLSKKTVTTGEKLVVSVVVKEIVSEPIMYRLPLRLGQNKGGINR